MSTILIKQIPDDYAEETGLSKYGRSRMPGCKDIFQAGINDDGRYITNIDEKALGVPVEQRERIKQIREELEDRVGHSLDAHIGNSFWESFAVEIPSDRTRSFNSDNAKDVIGYNMLVANRHVAPNKELAFTQEFVKAQYYAFQEEEEIQEEISDRKKRDRAISLLQEISENKQKLMLYGQYLEGAKYTSKLGLDTLYKMLRTFIESKEIKNASAFLEILKKPVEELQQKIIVDKAIKQRLITQLTIGKNKKVFQYGQVSLGATLGEVYKNLSLTEFAPELKAIMDQLENR